MKRKVIVYECDNCGDESTPEEMAKKNPIPANWVAHDISNNHGMISELLLCDSCDDAVKKALKKRQKKVKHV